MLLAGASGLWMIWRADMWERFADPRFWWMHAMVAVWSIFALMLFVLEPFFLHARMANSRNPEAISRASSACIACCCSSR